MEANGTEETRRRYGKKTGERDTRRKGEIERKISSERLREKGKEPEEKRDGETRKPDSLE